MSDYDIYPAVDSDYNFPPEIRTAMAGSSEVGSRIDDSVDSAMSALEVGVGVDPRNVGYDIIIVAGQSNAADYGGTTPSPATYDFANPRVLQYAASGSELYNIILGSNPLKFPSPDISNGVGPGMSFAREWVKRVPLNRSALIVPAAIGSTSLVGGPWAVGGTYYTQTINLANSARSAAGPNSKIVAIIWVQGEGDSVANRTQAEYATAFDAMIAGFRANIVGAANVPVIVGSMTPEWRNVPNGTSRLIHAAHEATPSRIANSFFVDGPTGVHEGQGAPAAGIHYTAKEQRLIGKRMCEVLWTAPAVPAIPTGLIANGGDGEVSLIWNQVTAIPSVTDFVVRYKPSTSSTWSTYTDGTSAIPGATITNLINGTSYDFAVAAVNDKGVGPFATVARTPGMSNLPAPSYLVDARNLVLTDNTALTTWPDESPNPIALDMTQATAAAKPTYRTLGIGKPSVYFDGGDSLAAASILPSALVDDTGSFSVVCVFTVGNFATNHALLALQNDTEGLFHLTTLTDGSLSFAGLNGQFSPSAFANVPTNSVKVAIGTRGPEGTRLYLNGVKGGTDGPAGAPAIPAVGYPFTMGRVSNALWPHIGHIAYAAIYRGVLTTGQRQIITNQLKTEFNIT